ncbi:hypothetical protein CDN99_23800 [Roseateles aquatilis]|uniref:Uncharacterized protein n=1 Tax=Roseateles aquatilis TaxID=431061 RepID=A0A246IX21_9BURK|nr:hypothetical protein [Roseateles aquatilis]OWQ84758.1 hypothetical protein CDN99_23800 [Roseateles aquatilis]
MQALDDIMDHAEELQGQAAASVKRLDEAAVDSAQASERLVACANALQERLTTQVAVAVAKRFDEAVTGASETIAADVKNKTEDLVKLANSFERTVRQAQIAIHAQQEKVEQRMLIYAAGGLAIGVALTVGLAIIFIPSVR